MFLIMIFYMNKLRSVIFLSLICLLSIYSTSVYASTEYYKILRMTDSKNNDNKLNGHLFITFNGGVCYESDSNGRTVEHGQLRKVNDTSKFGSRRVYKGNSYWGEAYYVFDETNKYLNIMTINGKKIICKRESKPNGVTTCSFIKSFDSQYNNGLNTHNNFNYVPADDAQILTNGGSNNSNNYKSRPVQNRRKCIYCDGVGLITKEETPISFGLKGESRKCQKCGKKYDTALINHYHIQCNHCRGTGFL